MVSINPLRKQKELHFKTFLIALVVATAFFIPFIVMDQGYFIFYGDFNVQQIPFYQMCHDKIRAGEFFWNWNTDLGVNFIGSYSFYLLGSPFFWLTIPFPSWMVPHLMGPLLILKFACAAFTAYFYIRRFTKTPQTAMLGGLLYAFSGFSIYNIFFNHFHEAIIFFPLLLVALELFIAENKRGPLIFATFICALSNYFFFFGMAVFCVIYWFVRMLAGRWHFSIARLFWLLFEIVIGVALAAIILLPAFYSVIQNDRVNSMLYGWNALLYGKNQIYLNVIEVFFFPPDLPARPVFFTGADVKWSSLGGWLPVFGMTAVIAWLQSKKNNWLRKIITILIIMALVPVLNSAFYALNSAYYARWFYIPVLMMSLVTALTLEDNTVDWNRGLKWSAIITLIFTLVIGLFPTGVEEDGSITAFGLFTDSDKIGDNYFIKYWISCAIALVSLLLVWYFIKLRKRSFRTMVSTATICVCIISVLYASIFIGTGKTQSYDAKDVMIDQLIEGKVDLPNKESNSYRIDVYDGVDNTGMFLGYPCIQAFHSIVPASVTNFYEYCGVARGVASRPETKFSALRPLLSVKYLVDRTGGNDFTDNAGNTQMPGWRYLETQGDYKIYQNNNYIPYGFTYDYYMTNEECERYSEEKRSNLMLKAILLSDDQIERNKDILQDLGSVYDFRGDDNTETSLSYKSSSLQTLDFSDSALALDSAARARTAATNFVGTSNGFTADVQLSRENLVFFAVPYEENGWTAYVDGNPVSIENVNVGLMAVRVPQGQHKIAFEYQTPGLLMGIKISAVCVPIILVYLLVVFYRRKRAPEKWAVEYPEGEELLAAMDADIALIAEFSEKPPEQSESEDVPFRNDEDIVNPVDVAFEEIQEPVDPETEVGSPIVPEEDVREETNSSDVEESASLPEPTELPVEQEVEQSAFEKNQNHSSEKHSLKRRVRPKKIKPVIQEDDHLLDQIIAEREEKARGEMEQIMQEQADFLEDKDQNE